MDLKIGDKFKMKYTNEIFTLYAISSSGRSYYVNKDKTKWFDLKDVRNNLKIIIKEANNE